MANFDYSLIMANNRIDENNKSRIRMPLIIAAVIIGIIFLYILSKDVSLQIMGNENVTPGTKTIICTLINPSFHIVKYGEMFSLEFLSNEGWTTVNDSEDTVNFELGEKSLSPFSYKEITFPVSVYSNMENCGLYRILFPVQIGGEEYFLKCQFIVEY